MSAPIPTIEEIDLVRSLFPFTWILTDADVARFIIALKSKLEPTHGN